MLLYVRWDYIEDKRKTRPLTNLEYDEFQFGDVVWMHPVLGSLSNEVLLAATCRSVTFDRVTPGPDQIIKPRQFDNEGIVVIFEKRLRIQPGSEYRLEIPQSLFL